jgi:hypothetical protein
MNAAIMAQMNDCYSYYHTHYDMRVNIQFDDVAAAISTRVAKATFGLLRICPWL